MNKDIDNPPAFPMMGIESDQLESGHIKSVYSYEQSKGMTLRDYFAAHAPDIDTELDSNYIEKAFPELGKVPKWSEDAIANSVWWIRANVLYKYRCADFMLAERSK